MPIFIRSKCTYILELLCFSHVKKDLTRVERQIQKAKEKVANLTLEQESASFDASRLSEISLELVQLEKELVAREEEWLEITLKLEN